MHQPNIWINSTVTSLSCSSCPHHRHLNSSPSGSPSTYCPPPIYVFSIHTLLWLQHPAATLMTMGWHVISLVFLVLLCDTFPNELFACDSLYNTTVHCRSSTRSGAIILAALFTIILCCHRTQQLEMKNEQGFAINFLPLFVGHVLVWLSMSNGTMLGRCVAESFNNDEDYHRKWAKLFNEECTMTGLKLLCKDIRFWMTNSEEEGKQNETTGTRMHPSSAADGDDQGGPSERS